jgi:hypothetical protein
LWFGCRLLGTSDVVEPETLEEKVKLDKALYFVQPTLTPELEFVAGILESGGRQFFKTQTQRMGFTLRGVQTGDLVCLLSGSPTPHVIRRVKEQADEVYRFVGDAFVDGMMHGEADTEDLDARDLVFV